MSGVSVHIADRGEVQERPVVRRLEQHAGPRLLRSALLHGNPRHPLILTMDTCAGRRFGCSRAGTTAPAPSEVRTSEARSSMPLGPGGMARRSTTSGLPGVAARL